jgi:hypothetical protein
MCKGVSTIPQWPVVLQIGWCGKYVHECIIDCNDKHGTGIFDLGMHDIARDVGVGTCWT